MMSGAMGLFWIWPVLVLVGVVLLGYHAYRLTQNRRPGSGEQVTSPGSARQILDERYARGEIDAQEYRRRRDELG